MFSPSELMAEHGVKALFSDRQGGCSKPPFDSLNLGSGLGDAEKDVQQNLITLCQQSGMALPHQVKQVHQDQLLHCEGAGYYHDVEADILLASDINVPLAVRTADCLPLLLADPVANIIAAVHAGWRGTVLQVAQKAVSAMCKLGAKPESILATLGPCIGLCCFEINAHIAEQLHNSCGEYTSKQSGHGLYGDLSKTNVLQLLASGLRQEHIEHKPSCTSCHVSPAYFSYRRDAGNTGRQLSMIMLS